MPNPEMPEILSKTERKSIFRRTLRTEFVENGLSLDELYKKYHVGKSSVYRWAARGNWRDERTSFLNQPDQPETGMTLSVADRRDRLVKWLRSITESAHITAMNYFNDLSDRAALPALANGDPDPNLFKPTAGSIKDMLGIALDLAQLRKEAFGEQIEIIEENIIYDVIVKEQKPRVRIIQDGDVEDVSPVIDIPASEVDDLGLQISPRNILPPTNGEPGENGEE